MGVSVSDLIGDEGHVHISQEMFLLRFIYSPGNYINSSAVVPPGWVLSVKWEMN